MDIHITNKTNKSLAIVYVIEKVRQLFSKHRVSKIVSSFWWRSVQTEKCSGLCCKVIDSCFTSNDVRVKSKFALNVMLEPKVY